MDMSLRTKTQMKSYLGLILSIVYTVKVIQQTVGIQSQVLNNGIVQLIRWVTILNLSTKVTYQSLYSSICSVVLQTLTPLF